MAQESFFEAAWLPFLPGYSWSGLLVWLLLILGLIGFFVSLFKGWPDPVFEKAVAMRKPASQDGMILWIWQHQETRKVYVSSRKAPKIWVLDQQTLAVRGEIPIRGEGHEMGVINRWFRSQWNPPTAF